MDIPRIYQAYWWHRHMPAIYMVYSTIYQAYTENWGSRCIILMLHTMSYVVHVRHRTRTMSYVVHVRCRTSYTYYDIVHTYDIVGGKNPDGRRHFSSYALSYDWQVSMGASEASLSTGELALSSEVNIFSWTKTIIRIIFCFILIILVSDQDWAACYFDLRTAGQHTTNLWEVSCHWIKKKALLAGIWAQILAIFFCIIRIMPLLLSYYTYYFRNQKCD